MKQKAVIMLMLTVLVAVSFLATGCAAPGLTKEGVRRRHVETFRNGMWQMQEDFDAFMMIDRPSRLSRYMVR